MRRVFFSLLLSLFAVAVNAQTMWYNPMECEYDVIQNQAFTSEIKGYLRLPQRAQDKVRSSVWGLAKQSAGLSITFYTNSPQIEVRYETTDKSYAMPHIRRHASHTKTSVIFSMRCFAIWLKKAKHWK